MNPEELRETVLIIETLVARTEVQAVAARNLLTALKEFLLTLELGRVER